MFIFNIRKFINKHKVQVVSILLLMIVVAVHADNISGHVYVLLDNKEKKQAAVGVNVYFADKSKRTVTDANGFFSLNRDAAKDIVLVASLTGYRTDSLIIAEAGEIKGVEFVLKEGVQLSGVVVTANKTEENISRLSVSKTEIINSEGLMKLPCCNLSQSFENSATVTVGYADAVSGAKQIQLLGLSGVYGQILGENIPILRGLSSPYGWNHIPGSWLESIQISKGTSSVLNGYEAITGQINLEFKKSDKVEYLYADVFANAVTDNANAIHMTEVNITGSRKISDKLWSNLLLHGNLQSHVHDTNGDHFMDMPKSNQLTAFNRWLYIDPARKLESRTGIRFLYEKIDGGQSPLCHKADVYYVTDVINKSFNVYNKTGIFVGQSGQSIAWINSFTYYDLNSYFGSPTTYKLYNGSQTSFYSNLMFSSWIGNKNNQYTVGLSFQSDNYQTYFKDRLAENNIPLTNINRLEIVPGAYAQYTWTPTRRFTLIVGLREDYNSFAGWLFTPRTNLRYALSNNVIFRLSGGRGYRTPNAIADNIGLMASTRLFDIAGIQKLKIEEAWNYGGNATFYIPFKEKDKITVSIDYFHTDFKNQAIADVDRNANDVWFYNSTAKSFANVWQADVSFSPFERFDVLTAFRYNQTIVTYSDGTQTYRAEKPMTPRFRGLLNLGYATKFRKWVFDFTAQLNGPVRLPNKAGYSRTTQYSPTYPVFFAQVTKNTKRFDVYAGLENLTNYRQANPIINYENPFVKGFDASQVWGPLSGRYIYAGIRLRLGKMY
jgi:outer membrane receptor for ferrienterochelin and colicin